MESKHKTVRIGLWAVLLLAMAGVLIGAIFRPKRAAARPEQTDAAVSWAPDRQQGEALRALFAAPDLTLTDQDGKTFSTRDLRGRPWVADFIFTSCAGSCPVMSHKMAEVQKKTPPDVRLVSFTVDPTHDTPAILKQYAEALKADPARWRFLTGAPQQMTDAAYAMKISVKPAGNDTPLLHSNKFLLIDRNGSVVGIYDGTSADDVKRLTADAIRLARGEGSAL